MESLQDFIKIEPSKKVSDEELQAWRAEVDRKDQEKLQQDILKNKRRYYRRDSLWGTSGEQTFSFEQWEPSMQHNVKKAQAVKERAIALFKKLRVGDNFNIMLMGTAGNGKTALVLAIMNALQRFSNRTVMFVSVVDLRELVMHDFTDYEAERKQNRVERSMREVDVLILDDFGSEAGGMNNVGSATERLQQFWFRVAEARQARTKDGKKRFSTIITTNNKRSDLERMYNSKIVSRLVTKKPENQIVFAGLEDIRE